MKILKKLGKTALFVTGVVILGPIAVTAAFGGDDCRNWIITYCSIQRRTNESQESNTGGIKIWTQHVKDAEWREDCQHMTESVAHAMMNCLRFFGSANNSHSSKTTEKDPWPQGEDLHREDENLQLRLDIPYEKCPGWWKASKASNCST